MHALAGIEHRPFCIHEQGGCLLHMDRVGAVARAQHRRVVQRLRHLFVPHVRGNLDDDRPAAPVLQFGKGASKNVGDLGGEDDGFGGLRERLHRLAGIEVRLDMREPALITHRQHQHGNRFAVALRDATHRVLRAGPMLHAERADAPPRRHPRDRIRHVHADALLPHHYGPDLGLRRVLDQMIDRIAAEDLDPLALHDFRDRGAELHSVSLLGAWPVGPGWLGERGSGIAETVKHGSMLMQVGQLCRMAPPIAITAFPANGGPRGPLSAGGLTQVKPAAGCRMAS